MTIEPSTELQITFDRGGRAASLSRLVKDYIDAREELHDAARALGIEGEVSLDPQDIPPGGAADQRGRLLRTQTRCRQLEALLVSGYDREVVKDIFDRPIGNEGDRG